MTDTQLVELAAAMSCVSVEYLPGHLNYRDQAHNEELLLATLRRVRAETLREAAEHLRQESATIRSAFLERLGDECYTGHPPELGLYAYVNSVAELLEALAAEAGP